MSRTHLSSPAAPRTSSRLLLDRRALILESLEERAVPATFTVMNLNDAGADSLRQAILDASGNAQNDMILFDAGLAGGTVNLTTGQLAHADAGFTLDIQGFAANNVTVNASLSSRVLDNVAGTLSIEGLALTGGLSTDGSGIRDTSGNDLTITDSLISGNVTLAVDAEGGGVYATGNVTLRNSTVQNNYSAGLNSEGGGVFSIADVSLDNSSIDNNFTAGLNAEGGGVYAGNDLILINNSTISGNRTLAVGGLGGGGFAGGNVSLDNSSVSTNYSLDAYSYGGGLFAVGAVTLQNGSSVDNNETRAYGSVGGGIYSSGTLTITDSTISGNSTQGDYAFGGGAFGGAGITITNSTVSGNSTTGYYAGGGGIYGDSASGITITDSTITGNSTQDDIAAGGGIFSYGAVGISGSTVSGNSTAGQNAVGGGVFGDNGVSVINSTVSGNQATGTGSNGGGVYSDGVVVINQSTISGNQADSLGGGIFGGPATFVLFSTITDNSAGSMGGGFHLGDGASQILSLRGSIVAGNNAPVGADVFRDNGAGDSSSIDAVFSVLGTAPANGFNGGTQTGNLPIGTDPLLGILADNGGFTLTHELMAGSPAIDAGDPAFMSPPDFDQRGVGFPRLVDGRIDIGAYEFSINTAPTVVLDDAPDVDDASLKTTYDVTVTYSSSVGIQLSTINRDNLEISGGLSALSLIHVEVRTIDANVGATVVEVVYRFAPPELAWEPSHNGMYTVRVSSLDTVTDLFAEPVAPGPIGTFDVNLTTPPPDSCSVTFESGVLTVSCDVGNNVVEVSQPGDGQIGINLDGIDAGAFDGVDRLKISTGVGDDTIRLMIPVKIPTEIFAGDDFDIFDFASVDEQTTIFLGPGSGAAGIFEGIESIFTGPADDTFVILPDADLSSGDLDGGGGVNALDFTRWGGGAVTIDLNSGRFEGLTFDNIDRVIGPLFQPNQILPPSADVGGSSTVNGLGVIGGGEPGSLAQDGNQSGTDSRRDPHGTSASDATTEKAQDLDDALVDGADAEDDPSTGPTGQSGNAPNAPDDDATNSDEQAS